MPWSKRSESIRPAAIAGSRTPATIAVNVFSVNPLTSLGAARVDVDHARGDGDLRQSRLGQQRVQAPPDVRVPALQVHERLDRVARRVALRVKGRRAVVALDHGERPARLEDALEVPQPAQRIVEVLEHEAHEDVVERGVLERQREEVGPAVLDVRERGCLRERLGGAVDRDEARRGRSARQRPRLRADAAARLEHAAARRVGRVVMEELDERSGLVVQAPALALLVAVDVVHVA
jgi:hypothetical protein